MSNLDQRTTNPLNLEILAARMAALDAIQGPRVGDFLEFEVPDERCRSYTRFTHDHGDQLQTGGSEHGSYYLFGGGGLSYSGGLDSGVSKSDLIATPRTRHGSVWFFDEGQTGPGRGVTFTVPLRVYTLREGANTKGLGELRCPYYLDQPAVHRNHGYWYLVTHHHMSHVAFERAEELHAWLQATRLTLTAPLAPQGTAHSQVLGWPTK